DAVEPEDLASLVYTSGTTGKPKGVEITHRNFRSNVNQVRKRFGPRPDKPDEAPVLDEEVVSLSFLPLAHVFERLGGHFLLFGSGATVSYAESPDTLREDFSLVEPTFALSVPRVYERMYEAIKSNAGDGIGGRVFDWSTEVGRRYHDADSPSVWLEIKHSIADRLVFSKVREALGGELEFLISGGSSLSPELCSLYHAMGIPVLEGYGLTETSPVVSANPYENPKVGTLGPAFPGVEVRVDTSVSVSSSEGDEGGDEDGNREDGGGDESEEPGSEIGEGELLVRGPNVTRGYWNKPEETEKAFVGGEGGERWFRTGDVIEIRDDGYLKFVERAKELLVLSTGKNVAPGPIEDGFSTSELVEQCLVIGDDRKFVGALVVPSFEGVRKRASREGVELPEERDEVCEDERVNEWIEEEVERVNEGFEEYERIKRFALVPEEWTEENGLLTPTLKKKRRKILERFDDKVGQVYEVE
ncbi:MAG: long-chain fatty acid--CoA ligase, partial [Halobacteria archaeon]|nr:long-chain fatty acid--CoA ligase [Halobacteria archaeon]